MAGVLPLTLWVSFGSRFYTNSDDRIGVRLEGAGLQVGVLTIMPRWVATLNPRLELGSRSVGGAGFSLNASDC